MGEFILTKPRRSLRLDHFPPAPLWKKEAENQVLGMPRTLIAISSCQEYEDRGWHEAMRQTWLPEAQELGMDYKFFFGRGSKQKDDVVIIDCHDGYFDLTNKLKGKLKWASFQDYDYVFACLADCYAAADRLQHSGYEKYDYFGDIYCHPSGIPYVQGGPGMFLSRRAIEILNKANSSYPNEDCWVGDQLINKDLIVKDSKDFVWCGHSPGFGPSPTNTHITAHLSNAEGGYRPELMWEKHKQYRG